MAFTNEGDAERLRLAVLRREIREAEATLLALKAAIRNTLAESDARTMHGASAEIERLAAANRVANQETESAYAALELAVRTSRTDPLTGLLNRAALWGILEHDIELARRNDLKLAVYFLDVDHFKQVNDAYGHFVGDRLLQGIADMLVATVRASDTVCRIGGDEFIVIAPMAGRDDAVQLAQKLGDALRMDFFLDGQAVASSTSIGFSIFPDDGVAAEALVRIADEAMYRSKRSRIERPDRDTPARRSID